eukprot:7381509-Prymnesium_polylepis.1
MRESERQYSCPTHRIHTEPWTRFNRLNPTLKPNRVPVIRPSGPHPGPPPSQYTKPSAHPCTRLDASQAKQVVAVVYLTLGRPGVNNHPARTDAKTNHKLGVRQRVNLQNCTMRCEHEDAPALVLSARGILLTEV